MSMTDKQTRQLLLKEWDSLEQIIEHFEEAWQGGQRPAIEDYLKPGDIEPGKLVLELVHADLECRLKAGEEVRVETYFERYPQIAGDAEGALGLIAAEYKFRQRREPDLTPADYERRFPQYREELAAHLLPLRQRESLPSHLSCPHCHQAIPLSEDPGEKQLTCSSCGGSFRFDLAHTPDWSPQALPRLGQFDLLKEIGQGAFGTVYRARDVDLGRIVAVKVPRVGRWLTPADQDRFVREARNVAQLAHPGIVPVYEVGRSARVPYLVSAYVEGITLSKVLTSRRFGFREAAEVIAQVAEALDHAHRHGVVHRDLKPSNIMLGRVEGTAATVDKAVPAETPSATNAARAENGVESRAFVMDFGLSRREEGEITVTIEGQVLGTPAYMSPEQARGEGHHVDGRSDIYSLGVILYELLTCEIPFRGVTAMILQQIQFEEPRSPRRLNDKIPRDLETIALKCMAKEPGRRYATAGEVAADLRRHLNGEPIRARPVGRLERCWRWSKRSPRVAGLLGLVALLLATVVIGSLVAAIQISQERDLAKSAQGEAESNANLAKAAQVKAEDSAEFASEQLALALGAFDQLVSQVQQQLQDKPRVQKLKENLLRAAIPGLQQVAQSGRAADAPKDVGNSIGLAHERLGDIFVDLGQAAQAKQHYEKAQAQFLAFLAAKPQKLTPARRNLYCTYVRLGDTAARLGDSQARREYYYKALELAQALVEAAPRDPQALRDLSETHNRCADLNRDAEDLEAALRGYGKGLELARAAADVEPQSTASKRALANSHHRIGVAFWMSGEFEAARPHLREVLELREALAAAEPESRLALVQVSTAHQWLGLVYHRLVNLPEALKHASRGVELGRELVAADPQDTLAQRCLLQAFTHLSRVHGAFGDRAAVREDLSKCLIIARKLAADRDDILAQTDLADNYINLGGNEIYASDYEEAAKWIQQGVTLLQELQAQGRLKDQPVYQRWLAEWQQKLTVCRSARQAIDDLDFVLAQPPVIASNLLVIRATALASRGQHLPAAVAAEKLLALDTKNVSYLYDAACCYALCVAGVGQGKSPAQLTPEETTARKRYAARALELLAAAVQLGYKNRVKIETDPDLAAIRQEEGYRALIERLKAKNKSP